MNAAVATELLAGLSPLERAQLAGMLQREEMKDKSYEDFPLGQDAAAYLRIKRKRLTPSSYRDYEGGLDKFARYFPDLELNDFEPPVGTQRLEEFLDAQWGAGAPRTYNKNLSILRDFFKFHVLRGALQGDPTLAIERARSRQVHRETFNPDQIRRITAAQDDLRDKLAVRLLLDFGLRKGSLKAIQFRHFDHYRRRLVIFAKGEKVRELPIPSQPFWFDLERLIQDTGVQPGDYLMCQQKTIPRAGVRRFWDKPASSPKEPSPVSGCTKPGTPPASASSTPPETSKPPRSCWGTRRSRRPATSTPTGISRSSRRR
jgi:hypothetical protein